MNDVHLHLLVNHVPVLGTVFALLVGTYALARRQPDVLRVALGVLVICGAGSFAATQTGERAEEVVEDLPGVSEALIHEHEEAAEAANIASIALAVLALGALVWRRRQPDVGTVPAVVLLVGALATAGLMARAANAGGEIRHPEIRGDGSSPALGDGTHDDPSDDDRYDD